jgi:hypothetical protein
MTHGRHYYLAPGGLLVDNEIATGRWVGYWFYANPVSPVNSVTGIQDIVFRPFYGKQKRLSQLLQKEKYRFNVKTNQLMAPFWLDAVGDVQPGPPPTDNPPDAVKPVIHRYRYIKPPDDCDGSLNCPPGESKSVVKANTAQKQHQHPWQLPANFWAAE